MKILRKKRRNNIDILSRLLYKRFKNQNIRIIFEIGARDCNETISFNNIFPLSQIFAFECNPSTLPLCREKVKGKKNIKLIEKAVCDFSGEISFYAIDKTKTITTWKDGNPGASSLFKASGLYDKVEKYVQTEIKVNCICLDDFIKEQNINSIDLLWMDIQGAELKALIGLKENLTKIKFIHTEVEFLEIYENQPLFWEVKKFLNNNGFYLYCFTSFYKNLYGDAIFININIIKNPIKKFLLVIKNKMEYLFEHYLFN